MRHAARALAVLFPVFVTAPAPAVETTELDQFEEKTLARAIERATRAAKSDRLLWVKELESAFPNKVGSPLKEEEYGVWFELVAEKAAEWKRDNSASAGIKELFDRVIQRMELGPVPSIRREEFMKYARKVLMPGNPSGQGASDPYEEADKVFRVLDRDGDGELAPEEMTTKLRENRKQVDTDGNGRIDKNEYRDYFQRRVATGVETAVKANEQNGRGSDGKNASANRTGKPGNGLPDWFTELDTNNDGQIALHEWRKGGKPIELFTAMDLDGDGLLTKEEYLRYVRMQEMTDDSPPALVLPGTPVKKNK